MQGMMATVEEIAKVCHAANTEYQKVLGEEPSPSWDELDLDMQRSVMHGVKVVQEGNDPQELHRQWMLVREAQGWTEGPIKDTESKIHPNLVDWFELPVTQQFKDLLFHSVVRALSNDPTKEIRNDE